MEPNNTIEQDFKQKLEQRTIQPTEMAWDRLDAMLTVAEKKNKPSRSWMYMAASFLAMLLVGALYLNQQKENPVNGVNNNTNSVVITTNADKPSETEIGATASPQITTGTEEVVASVNTPTQAKPRVTRNGSVKSAATAKNINNTPNVLISNEAVAVNNQQVTTNPEVAQPAKIKVDANELLASVNNPKLNSPQLKQSGVKVNANSLLSSVEGELNDSFKTKAFQGIIKNLDEVKTAVVNRNRQ
ncbi:hypothetical protein [Flavobacterium subsaxonicum]|uniref:Uncharacterized protein n=1 Tax=Flavobacterium subsaxonicum WB 4.1-42 = DSM 21790 TaxID=1121898 RepID=A0A0A2MKR9_9FLAO|nr:hypothetical protein [Flavobacterium subsaxonicum]KGO92078.1 hypothetical protein Q766_14390 [Flavobacterium subsaxonicum WB 4.1-42 = DSM 21790]